MKASKKKSNVLKYILTAFMAVFLLLVLVNLVLPAISTGMMEDDLNETEIKVDLDEEKTEDTTANSVILSSLLQRQGSE